MPDPSPVAVPRSPGAIAMARRHVAAAGQGWSRQVRETAVLLTSELVTNAIEHGTGAISLLVRTSDHQLRVEVADGSDTVPEAPASVDVRSERGRGLLLVRDLADGWGIDADPGGTGKTAWFELLVR